MLPVSTPQWARDKDRDAAIKLVEAAWANGQIVEGADSWNQSGLMATLGAGAIPSAEVLD